jgi:hypothetical protein
MRFMMIVIPKGYETAAPDAVPSAEAVAKMMEYNKSLQKAGVLLALDGLFPPSTGARISYADGRATVSPLIPVRPRVLGNAHCTWRVLASCQIAEALVEVRTSTEMSASVLESHRGGAG